MSIIITCNRLYLRGISHHVKIQKGEKPASFRFIFYFLIKKHLTGNKKKIYEFKLKPLITAAPGLSASLHANVINVNESPACTRLAGRLWGICCVRVRGCASAVGAPRFILFIRACSHFYTCCKVTCIRLVRMLRLRIVSRGA
jgi:hypothetical protein